MNRTVFDLLNGDRLSVDRDGDEVVLSISLFGNSTAIALQPATAAAISGALAVAAGVTFEQATAGHDSDEVLGSAGISFDRLQAIEANWAAGMFTIALPEPARLALVRTAMGRIRDRMTLGLACGKVSSTLDALRARYPDDCQTPESRAFRLAVDDLLTFAVGHSPSQPTEVSEPHV